MLVFNSNFSGEYLFRAAFKHERYRVDEHVHQFSEVVYVKEGVLTLHLSSRDEEIGPGQIAIISPYQVHSYSCAATVSLWLCLFDNSIVHDMISDEELYADRDRAVFTASPSLIAYLDGHLIDTGENLVPFELSSYRRVKSILTAIYEEYTFEVKPGKATKDNGILASLILYLKEHMVEDITLDTVSKNIGYSRSSISHCLTKYGVNFRTLLNSVRIEYAKVRLRTTDKRIVDIGRECGFSSEVSFHRVFLQMTGDTPGKYRKLRTLSPTLNYLADKCNRELDVALRQNEKSTK